MTVPTTAAAVVAGLFGLAIGSFLNVCSLRWPVDESVVAPGSRCPACGTPIRWYDNVPVASWIALRGRCRECGEGVSIQYPLVELATGLLWAGAVVRYGVTLEGFRIGLLLTLLFGVALSDARFYIIPDQFTLGGLAAGLLLAPAPGGIDTVDAVAGAGLGYVLLLVVAAAGEKVFGKEAMGGGDVKMMAMVGAFLGPLGVLLTVFLGALFGSLIFGPISAVHRWIHGEEKLVPFGIFLALGAAVTEGWGDAMVGWYVRAVLGG